MSGDRAVSGVRREWLPLLLLAGVVVVLYAPTLGHDFVYDDFRFIRDNTSLDSIDVVAFLTDPSTVDPAGGWRGIYRPLRTLSFALDRALLGDGPAGHHAVNLLLHLANGVLLYLLLRRLLDGRAAALLGALLFVAHPAMVEAVAWATSRDNGLFLFFLLPTFLLYVSRPEGPVTLLGIGVGFALALLAKETAIVLPVLFFLYELTIGARRPSLVGAVIDAIQRRWRCYITVTLIALVYLFLRYEALGSASGQRALWWEGSPLTTRLTAVEALAMYGLRTLVGIFPAWFTFDYQVALVRVPSDPRFWASALLVGGWLLAAVAARRAAPRFAFFSAWFFIALAPTANLVVPINILFADRFLYLAAIGPLALLGAGIVRIAGRRGRGPVAAMLLPAIPLTLFAVLSIVNVGAWRDSTTLWATVLEHFPASPRALRAHAFSLDRDDPALIPVRRRSLEAALRVEPDYPPARRDLGELLERAGDVEGAVEQYSILVDRLEKAAEPGSLAEYAYACRRLVTLLAANRPRAAISYGERLVPLLGDDVELRVELAELYLGLGDRASARRHLEAALTVDPRHPGARRLLADPTDPGGG